jgi:integrase
MNAGNQTFANAAVAYLDSLESRSDRPAAKTIGTYKALNRRTCQVFGQRPVSEISGYDVKAFVSSLRSEQYAPASIHSHVVFVKSVLRNIRDAHGSPLIRTDWDARFLDVPKVRLKDQKTPVATKAQIEAALQCGDHLVELFVALAAATGLRVSEILSLKIKSAEADSLDLDEGVIRIRKTLKTESAARTVFLPAAFVLWLRDRIAGQSGALFTIPLPALYRRLARYSLPPCHSYRRFRTTWCRQSRVLEAVLKNQLGHAIDGSDVTSRYDHTGDDSSFVRAEVERVGIGFEV